MIAVPLAPAPPAFFSPMSWTGLGPQHMPWQQQHLQSFQPPLPVGPPPRRPGHMRDTLEHHKLNLHDNKKSPPQPPLPGLPPQPLACLPPPPSPPQPPTNVAEKKGGNVIAHQTNKEGGKKEGSRPLFHTDSKSPDWTCNLCHTKNVSHLKLCSKCPGKQMHYEDHTIAMKAGDWGCTVCGNQKNFAYRATCYRCNSPRLPHARSTAGVGNKRCSGGKIISANIGEASEKLWKSPQHASDILDTRQYPEGDQVAQMEHDRLLEQEKQFDSMFEKWEANFEQWKSDNENNPDWDYVQSHIEDMNKLREKMLNRREALSRKREQLLGMEFLMEGKNNCVDCQRWKV